MNDKLKPCPLCGFDNIRLYGYDNPHYRDYQDERMIWTIKCGTCNLTLKNYNKDILKEIWNGRVNEIIECK